MGNITVLDQLTINQIAAGEVVERPSAVVKELVENAIDAGANAITVEIKEGGISFIRITDNGSGILKEDIKSAFLRHATSKIKSVEDLLSVSSLGFRGEALSSIAAVALVELVTKNRNDVFGSRYLIEGGQEKSLEEIGCPEGTTFIVRNLFYNTPARRKFLKSAATEGGYISDLIERLAISHPGISFKFLNNNQLKLTTSGNNKLKDIIYQVYGREIAANILDVEGEMDKVSVTGFIGKPTILRGNRSYENYFINGRYIKSPIITKAIEEAYKPYVMHHKYPFTSLHFTIDPLLIDVNVHPTKMEMRLRNGEEVYRFIHNLITSRIKQEELIPEVALEKEKKEEKRPHLSTMGQKGPEPFEQQRIKASNEALSYIHKSQEKAAPFGESLLRNAKPLPKEPAVIKEDFHLPKEEIAKLEVPKLKKEEFVFKPKFDFFKETTSDTEEIPFPPVTMEESIRLPQTTMDIFESLNQTESAQGEFGFDFDKPQEQRRPVIDVTEEFKKQSIPNEEIKQLGLIDEKLMDEKFIKEESKAKHKVIGQLFDTYWIVEFNQKMLMIDQHAAHEKVLYERLLADYEKKETLSQGLLPPIILSLNPREEECIRSNMDVFNELGFEIEHFGGKEYVVRAVPANLYGLNEKDLLIELLDNLVDEELSGQSIQVLEKVASMSCKAAVKGNQKLTKEEFEHLVDELMTLDNPYHCPHGRPIIIAMTKYEIEKKFKRIL